MNKSAVLVVYSEGGLNRNKVDSLLDTILCIFNALREMTIKWNFFFFKCCNLHTIAANAVPVEDKSIFR